MWLAKKVLSFVTGSKISRDGQWWGGEVSFASYCPSGSTPGWFLPCQVCVLNVLFHIPAKTPTSLLPPAPVPLCVISPILLSVPGDSLPARAGWGPCTLVQAGQGRGQDGWKTLPSQGGDEVTGDSPSLSGTSLPTALVSPASQCSPRPLGNRSVLRCCSGSRRGLNPSIPVPHGPLSTQAKMPPGQLGCPVARSQGQVGTPHFHLPS